LQNVKVVTLEAPEFPVGPHHKKSAVLPQPVFTKLINADCYSEFKRYWTTNVEGTNRN